MTSRNRKTGGELVAETLQAAGVDTVFALHGGHLEGLFKACADHGIRLVDFRHEAAAGHAADAYARTTGKLGVCIVTAGPGLTNAVSAIANAKLDGSSVLFIVGAPPLREMETNPLQGGIDQIALCRPISKWAVSVPSTERLGDLTAMAIRKARSAPKGPVVLELPIDVLHMSVDSDKATPPVGVNIVAKSAPASEDIRAVAALVAEAKQPVIIAGMEAANREAARAIRQLADASGLPVFCKNQARGVLPHDHPSNCGAAGTLAALAVTGGPVPDLVILLGGRLGLLLGGRSAAMIPNAAKLVQVYSDPSEIGRIRDVDVAVAADTEITASMLAEAFRGTPARDFSTFLNAAKQVGAAFGAMFPDEGNEEKGIHPYFAAKTACEVAGTSAIFVLDGGEAASWAGDCARVDGAQQVIGHGYLGCLGIGPGFAIGAQIAHPDRRVIQMTGDGAMGFHIQEFDTMMRHGLPIVTVVMNNRIWGMSIHGQQMMYGANYNVITLLGDTGYANVAAAFGAHAERVVRPEDVGPAMKRALDSNKPALVEIMTDPDVVHPITVSMLGKVKEGSQDIMIPYYENIAGE
ncbi:MAG: thiamine pyrophosphate-binding protein [Hyphomonas sp.]|nr:thiamine pyrophosphate-binding protein [Hyphomonas sp.]